MSKVQGCGLSGLFPAKQLAILDDIIERKTCHRETQLSFLTSYGSNEKWGLKFVAWNWSMSLRMVFMTQRVKLLLLPFLSGLLITSPSFAQQTNQIRYPVNEELKLTLKRADRLLEKGKFEEALDLYIDALRRDKDPKEAKGVFETTSSSKKDGHFSEENLNTFRPRRFVGISHYIHQKLKKLPPKVQAIYRERNDYRAKAEFKKAVAIGTERALEDFYADYAASSLGPMALTRLANIAIEKGSLARANRHFSDLVTDHKYVLSPAEIRVAQRQRLMCLVGLGRLTRVRALCDALGIKAPKGKLSFGNSILTRPQIEERTVRYKGGVALRRNKGISHIRGQTNHANTYESALWIGRSRFMPRNYASIPRPRNTYSPYSPYRRTPNYSRQNKSNNNSTLPIVLEADRRVNGSKVKEPIALLSTGNALNTVWLKDGAIGPRILLPSSNYYVEPNDKVLHGGAVSHRIFVTSFVSRVNNAENYKGIPIKVNLPVRKLGALDTKRWRWIWNHQDVLKGTPFAKASFPSPPVIVEDTIYASAIVIEGFVRSYVLAFDLYTGSLKWATWICSGQVEQTMFGEHAREPLVSSVAVKEGRIYHCSSLGSMACLNARTGKPIWMTSYEQIEIEPPRGYYPVQRSLGWANNPPIVSGGVVVATPLDSNHALAYDIETGKRKWKISRRFNNAADLEFLIGASEGRVVIAGRQVITCFGLKSGSLLWKQDRFFNEHVAGRGLIANGRACLSIYRRGNTYPARISQYDLKTGKLVRTERTSGSSGGDLAMFGDTVLILGPGVISAFENKEPRRRSRDF
jgi:hypothetical protein